MNLFKKLIAWWNAPLVINGKEEICWVGGGILRRKDWWLGRLIYADGFGYAHSYCVENVYSECHREES